MVKSINIILVIILTALITTIGAAPECDYGTIIKKAQKMSKSAAQIVSHRPTALCNPVLSYVPGALNSYLRLEIGKMSSPPFPLFTVHELLQSPNGPMHPSQAYFTRAYHSLVYEKLQTLFMKIQVHMHAVEQLDSEELEAGLARVAPYLLMHHDLEGDWRAKLNELCSEYNLNRRLFSNLRALELPEYDWEHVHAVLLPTVYQLALGQLQMCNDVNTEKMVEWIQMLVRNVIDCRPQIIGQGLTFNLYTALNPRLHLATKIAQIRSESAPYPFTEEQLLEKPKASMPQDRLYLTKAYHRLVIEELTTFFETIKHHFGAHEQALAEVGGAFQMHQILESKYDEILETIAWHRQVIAYIHQLSIKDTPECGLVASTSQPRPQQVFVDFLGIAGTTGEAAPGNHGHSHDDRDPFPDNRYSSELHRPPSGHVDFVGESSMHPGPFTDNIRRAGDSSLHGHESTSNIGVADSPQKNTRVKLFGQWLGST
ncbi:hypothetical protein SeLEV6574_g08014 [Synchytrium endobioticum]|uniref:Uncharacterized protein n=2 Tax=Synchytrium endobioticum TaxID=286115 RepID=A0A507CC72_9FUNG|nr:hypothetical protein SeLEV6574_g08014 [Synchytrium endobioticum]